MVWAVLASGIVLARGASAATYSARAHWRASTDATVTGYRVYTRAPGGAFTLALDARMPVPAADGTLATVVPGLDVCTSHGIVVTAYRADGVDSVYSNEIVLTYAQIAPLIDTDADGLTNAQEDRDLDCVVDPGETDPTRADTDGDGIPDGRDACQGTASGAAVNASGCACAQIRCDDGNACNGVETCVAGVCQPGTAPNCNDGNACTTDACNAATGCTHTAIAGCVACTSAAQCNDGNACTADACSAGRCTHTAVVDGTSCSDGRSCNGVETCRAGVCTAGVAPSCDDGNPCTADSCSDTGGCTHTPIAGCTACTGAAQCDDGNACTTDSCSAGRCVHAAAADGTACSDGVFCNGAETCRAGACVAGPPPACDDGNACTTDACDEGARRCTHTPLASCCTSDADCSVADACHTNARCDTGQCVTDPVVCPDPGTCAVASCDPQRGCETTPVPDGTPCDDGNACTVGDVCTAGACGSPTPITALSVDAGTAPAPTRLEMRASARGLIINARASFRAVDPTSGDFHVALRDEGGATMFARDVPASGFTVNGARAVYRDDQRAAGGALVVIELRTHDARTVLGLRAMTPATDAAPAGFTALRTARTPAGATIDWSMRSSGGCVNGSGQCRGKARRCR